MTENKVSKSIDQFSRHAYTYDTYNVIQAEVAKILVKKLTQESYACILDIGCGSGAVYHNIITRQIEFQRFIALDASREMLSIHPNTKKVEKVCANFNRMEAYEKIKVLPSETLLVSASALQWSQNLDFSFRHLSQKAAKVYFAIFTSNTFKTLHHTANVNSPIYSASRLKEIIKKYYVAQFNIRTFRLEFETVKDMFKYIKKSGVSGGDNKLTYKQTKQLMKEYPLKYLEFEVLFVEGTSLA